MQKYGFQSFLLDISNQSADKSDTTEIIAKLYHEYFLSNMLNSDYKCYAIFVLKICINGVFKCINWYSHIFLKSIRRR